MNKKENIDKLIDEAMSSIDSVKRAAPMPFLFTRINARLNKTKENVWEKATWFIGRPVVAITGMVMLVLINVTAVVYNRADKFIATEQSALAPSDEFSDAVATIYDIENTEP